MPSYRALMPKANNHWCSVTSMKATHLGSKFVRVKGSRALLRRDADSRDFRHRFERFLFFNKQKKNGKVKDQAIGGFVQRNLMYSIMF